MTAIQNTPTGISYFSSSAKVTVVGELTSPRLASVLIFPANPALLTEQIYRFGAAAFDQDGALIPAANFVWQVQDPSIGRINSIGYLTVEGPPGAYEAAVTVTAIWEGAKITAATDVTVVTTPKADDFLRVQALPQRFHLDPGDRLQLRAVALNGLGEMVSGTELRWNVEDPAAGTIDGRGMFIAGDTSGIYTEAVRVEAIVPGERGFIHAVDFASVSIRTPRVLERLAALHVFPQAAIGAPGSRTLLMAQPVDEAGEPADNVTITWEMAKDGVGEIDPNGSFKATGPPGINREAVRVTVEQEVDGAVITRTQLLDVTITGTLARVDVHPSLLTLAPGRTAHFSAVSQDEHGTTLLGLLTVWRVSNPDIGTIDAFGNFRAGDAPGLYEAAILAEVTQVLPLQP